MEQRTAPARSKEHGRWSSRPFLSALLRLFIFLVPTAASLTTAVVVSRLLRPPTGGLSTAMWWAAVLGTSLVVLFVVQRLARRLMPLALLLRLTLTFPDRAPSRYRVARRSGNLGELRQQLVRTKTGDQDPDQAVETILALATAISSHDRQTRGHSERVRVFTDMLGEELEIPDPDRDRLRWAALLHDVGKLEVPSEILNKAGPLDEEEWKVVRQHPGIGVWLIGPLASWLGPFVRTIEQHHERYDGDGYPNRLRGEDISIGGRIVSVADAYDTMTAARAYKKPLSAAAAREELSRQAGKQFDPDVVRAMMNISLGRLWWRVGFLSWLAQIPLVGPASRFMGRTMQTTGGAAGATAAAAVLGIAGIAVPIAVNNPVTAPETLEVALAPPTEVQLPTVRVPRNREPNDPVAETAPIQEGVIEAFAAGAIVDPPPEPSDSGNSGGGGEIDDGDQGGGEEPGGSGSGGEPEDRDLIRFVVETVEKTVDDLTPLPDP